jgi:hypothetical protein
MIDTWEEVIAAFPDVQAVGGDLIVGAGAQREVIGIVGAKVELNERGKLLSAKHVLTPRAPRKPKTV